MIDFERRRETLTPIGVLSYYMNFLFGLIIGQVLINMVLDRIVSFIIATTTFFVILYGLVRWTSTDQSMLDNITNNSDVLLYQSFSLLVMLAFSTYLISQYHNDLMMSINQTVHLQEEIERVLENLDEAIICRSKQGISFCNNVGFRIL